MAVETLRVAPELTLGPPTGPPIRIHQVKARLEHHGEALQSVWLIAELEPATWARVDAERLFHLEPEVRGSQFGAFHTDRVIYLEARLARDPLTTLALLGENEWEVLAQVFSARLVPSLHQTESWYALHVTQQQGPIRGGFRTTWADASEVPPIA